LKKIFTLLSIIFALLAGFNACGNANDSATKDETTDMDDTGDSGIDTSDTGDTTYGVGYTVYVKVSGVIVNEYSAPINDIKINFCKNGNSNCDFVTASDTQGKFEFTEFYGNDSPREVTLMLYDLKNEYSSTYPVVKVNCDWNNDSQNYLCESDDLTLTLEKAPEDDDDVFQDHDIDVEETDLNNNDSDNAVLNDSDSDHS